MAGRKQYIVDNYELLQEWSWEKNSGLGFEPDKLTLGSGRKVWWKCAQGHEWQAVIGSRNNGFGCPYCGGKMLLPGINDLATVNPTLASEWDYQANGDLTPEMVAAGSEKQVSWICEKGHRWKASVGKRNRGRGCPVCAGKQTISGYNDFATIVPALVCEWDYDKNKDIFPTNVSANSHKKVWWKCKTCGNEWEAIISERSRGYGCPKCGIKKAQFSKRQSFLKRKGTLAERTPALANEWHPSRNGSLTPADVAFDEEKTAWWKCSVCEHEWQARISTRQKGSMCPKCQKLKREIQKSLDIKNKGAIRPQNRTSFPEQAIFFYISKHHKDALNGYTEIFENGMELDIYIPSLRTAIEYDGIVWHNTEKTYAREQQKFAICRAHGIRLIRIKENEEHTKGDTCDILLFCKSSLDETITQLREYLDLPDDIDSERNRIIIEEGYLSALKQNSISAQNPALAKEWHPNKNGNLSPDMFQPHSSQKVWWMCEQGHEWQAVISSRSDGTGCPFCSGRVALKGQTDLVSKYPSLAMEWLVEKNGDLLPSMVVPGSNKLVWWKCSQCGLEWRARIKDRSEGKRCPSCNSKPPHKHD